MTAAEQLQQLQQRISALNDNEPEWIDEFFQKLYFADIHGFFHVEFVGTPFEEAFQECLQTVALPEVGHSLRSLTFRGPDEGANGTRNWDFTKLIHSDASFPNLKSLFIEPTSPEHHSHTILAQDYEEDGMAAGLVAKMPQLLSLTLPSAPNAAFFSLGCHPLAFLRVDSGYDHQGFIHNLSGSSCFPDLRFFDFGDYAPRDKDDPNPSTPFADYASLLQSKAFHKVGRLNLRNISFSSDQLRELNAMKPDLQLFVIQSYGFYIR